MKFKGEEKKKKRVMRRLQSKESITREPSGRAVQLLFVSIAALNAYLTLDTSGLITGCEGVTERKRMEKKEKKCCDPKDCDL